MNNYLVKSFEEFINKHQAETYKTYNEGLVDGYKHALQNILDLIEDDVSRNEIFDIIDDWIYENENSNDS